MLLNVAASALSYMSFKRKSRKGKRIAPVDLWGILLPAEKTNLREVLIQIAEEIMAAQYCENSPKQVLEEIVIHDTTVH